MALGVNRDYKTNDRRVRKNLAIHKQLMDRYISHGLSEGDASALALKHMEDSNAETIYEHNRVFGTGYAPRH